MPPAKKSRPPQKRNRPVLAVTMNPEIRAAAELAATTEGITVSRWIERAVRAELDRMKRRVQK